MEEINKFLGGINQDNHPTNQGENTVFNMVNFSPLTKDGNLYSITNEDGTSLLSISFPGSMKPIGNCVLNTDLIVLLADSSGNSQVGVIREDTSPHPTYGRYHPIAPVDVNGNTVNNNKEFGWSIDYPIDVVSRKLINGHRIIYFTDNKNPSFCSIHFALL
jgi:hypothetical protein